MKIPQNVNFLERGIRALVDSNDKAYRLRVMMANVVVGQFLRDGVLRGGTSMKLRYGANTTRFTMDFDVARKTALETFMSDFAERLKAGWGEFEGDDWESLYDAAKVGISGIRPLDEAVDWATELISASVGASTAKVERNREAMRLFEKCINTNDLELGRKLISEKAAFDTPVSPTPLYGAKGYLSVVTLMRKSFPDVRWKLVDMVADEKTVAVQWECSGTFNGDAPFAGLQPNGRRFSTTVMNFYSFDDEGMIFKDVAATGIAGILQGIGAIK